MKGESEVPKSKGRKKQNPEQEEILGLKLALAHIEAQKVVWTNDTQIPPSILLDMLTKNLQAMIHARYAPR